jgi:hypothetical protein
MRSGDLHVYIDVNEEGAAFELQQGVLDFWRGIDLLTRLASIRRAN